jgi:hypothetical protein
MNIKAWRVKSVQPAKDNSSAGQREGKMKSAKDPKIESKKNSK